MLFAFHWISESFNRWQRSRRLKLTKEWYARMEAYPRTLALEPRRVFNAAPVAAHPVAPHPADVVISPAKSAAAAKPDTFVISRAGNVDVVTLNGHIQQVVPAGSNLTIQGASNGEVVKIDFSNGNPLAIANIQILSAGGTNSVQFIGTAQSVTYVLAPDGTTTAIIDGNSVTISAGISIVDSLSVNQRTVEIDSAGNVELTTAAATGNEEILGPSGQDIQFAATATSLEIDLIQAVSSKR
jgi:hypothetical protein